MGQEPEEKLWLDRDFFEIPVLFYSKKKPDYKAIMSRFHYLLLKKDPGTHEELIKCWAILIVTAPDAFDGDPSKRYNHLIFSGVQETAIKLDRPIEEIEFPSGEPKLEGATNFLYENWKLLCGDNHPRNEDMDDLCAYQWYTKETDIISARTFFGVYCLNLLGAYTDQSAYYSSIRYCALNWISEPLKHISFSRATATFLRDAFVSQAETFLKVLRMVLDWYEYHTDHKGQRSSFFWNKIRNPLIYRDLGIMKFAMNYLDDKKILPKLKSAITETGSEGMKRSLESFNTIFHYLNCVRLQDESFLRVNLHLRGEQCRLWPYSRYISPQYFKSLDLKDNLEFFAFLVGSCANSKGTLYGYFRLEDQIDDKHDRESLEEEIERGWSQGQAIYVLENPPK